METIAQIIVALGGVELIKFLFGYFKQNKDGKIDTKNKQTNSYQKEIDYWQNEVTECNKRYDGQTNRLREYQDKYETAQNKILDMTNKYNQINNELYKYKCVKLKCIDREPLNSYALKEINNG